MYIWEDEGPEGVCLQKSNNLTREIMNKGPQKMLQLAFSLLAVPVRRVKDCFSWV